jgi:hypothetical protein
VARLADGARIVRDYRDDTIEAFALSEAQLLDRIADLQADIQSYRDVAVAGLHHAHDLQIENDRLGRNLKNLQDEYRAFRAQVMRAQFSKNTGVVGEDLAAGYTISTGSGPVSQVTQ